MISLIYERTLHVKDGVVKDSAALSLSEKSIDSLSHIQKRWLLGLQWALMLPKYVLASKMSTKYGLALLSLQSHSLYWPDNSGGFRSFHWLWLLVSSSITKENARLKWHRTILWGCSCSKTYTWTSKGLGRRYTATTCGYKLYAPRYGWP